MDELLVALQDIKPLQLVERWRSSSPKNAGGGALRKPEADEDFANAILFHMDLNTDPSESLPGEILSVVILLVESLGTAGAAIKKLARLPYLIGEQLAPPLQ